MGIIKEYYEENGKEYLSNYLIGAIKGDITDTEKVANIEKLLNEYDDVKAEDK